MSTHNLCFRAKIRKNVYPCTPQFHYIKVGCKGVQITRICFPDVSSFLLISFLSWLVYSYVVAVCTELSRGLQG